MRYFWFLFLLFVGVHWCSCQDAVEEYHFKQIGSLRLNYVIRGKGPVMIVGHPSSGKIGYELTLKPLEKYFTMVYYEPRGVGQSESPKRVVEYGQDYMVDEIEGLRKELKVDKIWIFGHSDQSAIALVYALKYANNTAGLILTGTSYIGLHQDSMDRRKKTEMERSKNSPWFAQVVKDWDFMIERKTKISLDGRDISFAPVKWWCYDEESSQKVITIVKEISKAGRRKPVNNEYFVESEKERGKYLDYQSQFSKINAKVLIVNGKYDTNNPPEYVEMLAKILPNSKLEIIDKAGHFPWIESEEVTFSKIKKWLEIN